MRACAAIAASLCFLSAAACFADDDPPQPPADTVVLQGLNKVTGHILKIEGAIGDKLTFGNIDIIAQRCWKSAPEDRPENAALLDIVEHKPDEPDTRIFRGWMFSSSPGLSGLEHPVYDITVIDCLNKKSQAAEVKTDKPEKPDAASKKAAKP